MPLVVWQYDLGLPSVGGVPTVRAEDREYARRLGAVLVALRQKAAVIDPVGWGNRPLAAERLGVSETSLGRWERGDNPPKGYDLSRLFRGYEAFGAKWEWFFNPPEVREINPVRDELAGVSVEPQPERQRGWWLAMARERAGMGQGRLAFLMGVTTATIRAWEERRSQPSIIQESRLAQLLDVPLARPEPRRPAARERRTA